MPGSMRCSCGTLGTNGAVYRSKLGLYHDRYPFPVFRCVGRAASGCRDALVANEPCSRCHAETERRIRANDAEFNLKFNYSVTMRVGLAPVESAHVSLLCRAVQNNYIQTSKYTLLSFLPVNLIEQFQRLANFYFLCLLVLQFIPFISSLTPVTTVVPLVGVLLLTAIKDAYDDYVSRCSIIPS